MAGLIFIFNFIIIIIIIIIIIFVVAGLNFFLHCVISFCGHFKGHPLASVMNQRMFVHL